MFPFKWISCSQPDVDHAGIELQSFAFLVSGMNTMTYKESSKALDCLRQSAHMKLLLYGFCRVEGNVN